MPSLDERRAASPNGPDHFHVVERPRRTVRVRLGGDVLAESERPVALKEVGRGLADPVYYLPREDVRMDRLARVEGKASRCPIKGRASYLALAGDGAEWLAWSYEEPLGYSAEIAGLVAFDPSRVTLELGPLG